MQRQVVERKFLKYLATTWRCIINTVNDVPADRYSEAIKALEAKRKVA